TGRLSDARILALNSYENRVYQVGLDDQDPVIVKFYRPGRWSVEQIDEEHRFTRFLQAHEIPVVPPFDIDESGEYPTIGSYEGFYFAIFPRQGGRAPELDNLDHLHHLGRFIGRMHAVGTGFRFEYRPRMSASQSIDNVKFLLEAGFIPADLEAAYRAITAEVLAAIEACRPDADGVQQISLHGDCHGGNMLWRDDELMLLDFDDCRMAPAMQDIWMLLSGDKIQQQQWLSEVVEGYEEYREFPRRELALIEPLRTIRMIYYSGWLAQRREDPAFIAAFAHFGGEHWWLEHINALEQQKILLNQPPIALNPYG
ncbi:MAG: serine/threonine protein kinase, partial [Oceanospirillum sp.]|nr:serine/threonine protein kinase [Oceanospirillum sp.]